VAKKYKSDVSRSVHRAMADLHDIGGVDKTTMREFDRLCLTKTEMLTAADIGVTTGLISKWECGDKHPSRMALKLLSLVKVKGLAVIA
jgi:putative transcriptional regulator